MYDNNYDSIKNLKKIEDVRELNDSEIKEIYEMIKKQSIISSIKLSISIPVLAATIVPMINLIKENELGISFCVAVILFPIAIYSSINAIEKVKANSEKINELNKEIAQRSLTLNKDLNRL